VPTQETEEMTESKDEQLTVTMSRQAWDVLLYLAIRGGKEALDLYVRGQAHTANCIVENANVVKDLHDKLHPDAPMREMETEAVH
jgi:hypothetical protein